MLETKIENLTKEVENLRVTMLVLIQTMQGSRPVAEVAAVVAAEDDSKIPFDDDEVKESIEKGVSKVEEKSEASTDETITRDDLQSLCTRIVRSDDSKRDTVKDIIQSFGGSNLTKVDESKYGELKVALEKLL